MTPASLLTLVGQALCGPEFRSALARSLEVSPREVQRWAAGTAPVPPGVWRDLADLIEEDLANLSDARVKLDAYVLSVDPRDPNPLGAGMFRDHDCYRCKNGALPCVAGEPRRCDYPRARND